MTSFEITSLTIIILGIIGLYGYKKLVKPNQEEIIKNLKHWWLELDSSSKVAIKTIIFLLGIYFLAWFLFFANIRGVETSTVEVVNAVTTNKCIICGEDHGRKTTTITFNDGEEFSSHEKHWIDIKPGESAQKTTKKKLFMTTVEYSPK